MSNRQNLIDRLLFASPQLLKELDYYLNDVDHEDEYDSADAFEDYRNLIEENEKMTIEIKKIMVEIGYCIEVDISKIQVSHGKKYWFILNKRHYDCIESWSEWIKK